MKERIITTIVGLPLVVVVLIFSNTLVLPIAFAIAAGIGTFEMLGCIGLRKYPSVTVPSLLISAALTFLTYFGAQPSVATSYFMAIFASVAFIYMFYLMALSVVSKGTKQISDMALCAVTTLYITVGFSCIIILRALSGDSNYVGVWMFALVFVGAWVPDGAGYFVGRAFGKHKLIPDVSPKKTVEGAIGGVLFGGIAFILCGLIAELTGTAEPKYIQLALTGIVVAVVSIFGDLIASLIKRHYKIKDYGKLFPGHGGVMDRFDSIIAVSPFLVIACSHPEIFALFA